MQTVFLAGNVGKDAELRTTQSGDKVLGFSLAVDNGKDRDGNKRDATWWECSIWGKRAESLAGHITKGTKLSVQGRPGAREYNGKAYLTVAVDQFAFQGGKPSQADSASYSSPQDQTAPAQRDLDTDIPFAPEWRL